MQVTISTIPCAECLTERPTDATPDAPCPVCRLPLMTSLRKWERFGSRDGRILSGALQVIVWCGAITILPTVVIAVLSAFQDMEALRANPMQSISPSMVALGVVGMCSAIPMMAAMVAWIMILAISFGGVLGRMVLPLAVLGASTAITFGGSFVASILVSAMSRGSSAQAGVDMQLIGGISGGVYGLVWTLGMAWAVTTLQSCLTRDRTGCRAIWTLAVATGVSSMATVAIMHLTSEAPIDSVVGILRVVVGLALSVAFQVLLIHRAWSIRTWAKALTARFATLQFGSAAMTVSESAPPVLAIGRATGRAMGRARD